MFDIHTPIEIKYANSYVKKLLVPLSTPQRVSFDAYISDREVFVKSTYNVFIGIKALGNEFGVVPKTFNLSMHITKDGHAINTGVSE